MTHNRIAEINLHTSAVISLKPEIEHERRVAVADLLAANVFSLDMDGPYRLDLALSENRLVLDISNADSFRTILIPIKSFKSIIKDYFLICESYFEALKTATTSGKIEAIDMGRRAIHNEGSELLIELLKGKAEVDFETARRLFTLICILHFR